LQPSWGKCQTRGTEGGFDEEVSAVVHVVLSQKRDNVDTQAQFHLQFLTNGGRNTWKRIIEEI
jgi:hypothetical protein